MPYYLKLKAVYGPRLGSRHFWGCGGALVVGFGDGANFGQTPQVLSRRWWTCATGMGWRQKPGYDFAFD